MVKSSEQSLRMNWADACSSAVFSCRLYSSHYFSPSPDINWLYAPWKEPPCEYPSLMGWLKTKASKHRIYKSALILQEQPLCINQSVELHFMKKKISQTDSQVTSGWSNNKCNNVSFQVPIHFDEDNSIKTV